jgi:hypothetical protein
VPFQKNTTFPRPLCHLIDKGFGVFVGLVGADVNVPANITANLTTPNRSPRDASFLMPLAHKL